MSNDGKIVLVDLDGTLANYTKAMERDLEAIRSPEETGPLIFNHSSEREPGFYRERVKMIRSQPGWWLNLERLLDGWHIYNIAVGIGFTPHILTKGPRSNPTAFTEKVQWCQKHLGYDVRITISGDKSLVYGRVLIDDYPPYVEGWLNTRPRGLAILPQQPWNEGFEHPNAIRYDVENHDEVYDRLKEAYDR